MTEEGYVAFVCPVCETPLRFCREDRWGQTRFEVVCLKPMLGGYMTCEQRFLINTTAGKTYVITQPGGKPVAARLLNII